MYNDYCRFRGLFVAGEHCDKETLEFARSILKAPILDNWWQTGQQILKIVSFHFGRPTKLTYNHVVKLLDVKI